MALLPDGLYRQPSSELFRPTIHQSRSPNDSYLIGRDYFLKKGQARMLVPLFLHAFPQMEAYKSNVMPCASGIVVP